MMYKRSGFTFGELLFVSALLALTVLPLLNMYAPSPGGEFLIEENVVVWSGSSDTSGSTSSSVSGDLLRHTLSFVNNGNGFSGSTMVSGQIDPGYCMMLGDLEQCGTVSYFGSNDAFSYNPMDPAEYTCGISGFLLDINPPLAVPAHEEYQTGGKNLFSGAMHNITISQNSTDSGGYLTLAPISFFTGGKISVNVSSGGQLFSITEYQISFLGLTGDRIVVTTYTGSEEALYAYSTETYTMQEAGVLNTGYDIAVSNVTGIVMSFEIQPAIGNPPPILNGVILSILDGTELFPYTINTENRCNNFHSTPCADFFSNFISSGLSVTGELIALTTGMFQNFHPNFPLTMPYTSGDSHIYPTSGSYTTIIKTEQAVGERQYLYIDYNIPRTGNSLYFDLYPASPDGENCLSGEAKLTGTVSAYFGDSYSTIDLSWLDPSVENFCLQSNFWSNDPLSAGTQQEQALSITSSPSVVYIATRYNFLDKEQCSFRSKVVENKTNYHNHYRIFDSHALTQSGYASTMITGSLCGDGIVRGYESCEQNLDCNDTNALTNDSCNFSCSCQFVDIPPSCGDAICNTSESCSSCPQDCGSCPSGSGSPRLSKDNCTRNPRSSHNLPCANEDGIDRSESYYDKTCCRESINALEYLQQLFVYQSAHGSAQCDYYDINELNQAYEFGYSNKLLDITPCSKSRMDEPILRKELAKIMSIYATDFLGKQPQYRKTGCDAYLDISQESDDTKKYIQLACELEIMGLHQNGKDVKYYFDPNLPVTRAMFGTVLSRLLFGEEYNRKSYMTINSEDFWYRNHLLALQKYNIMHNIDGKRPYALERRGWTLLMLERTHETGLSTRAKTNSESAMDTEYDTLYDKTDREYGTNTVSSQ